MVQQLQRGPSIAEYFTRGLEGSVMPALQQLQQRNLTLQGLQQAKQSASQAQTPSDLLFSLLEATAGRPGAERALGQLYPSLLQNFMAQKSLQVPVAGEQQPMQRDTTPVVPSQRQNLPGFMQQPGQPYPQPGQTPLQAVGKKGFFPTNVNPNEAPGNLPQAATAGIKRPVYSPQELIPQARQLAKEKQEAGIPTSVSEAYRELKERNDEDKIYNSEVDKELGQRIESQRESGEMAVKKLVKLMPKATDEQQAIFRKIGENVRGGSKSEADFDRTIAKEATKFKNTIANIEKDLSAPRLQNRLHRLFLGTDKDFQSAASDLRTKVKPLLDLGLYDTTRNLLDGLGYYPEERESIIQPLTERAQTAINLTPAAKKATRFEKRPGMGAGIPTGTAQIQEYTPADRENIREGLLESFAKEPNSSLVLLRKGFEDKGYDWRLFKDTLNDLVQSESISLNDDQFNQLQYLDQPPLNLLEKILQSLNVQGR